MEEEDIGLLRSKGIPCASVMRIAPGTDDVELRLRVFFREHNHLHGHAIVISYSSDTNPQNPEDEDDESYFYIRAGADDSQLQSRVIELMAAAPDRAVCVRTSAANGRIGLMLHRLPPLLITVRCMPDTNVHIERAILAGSSAPVLPSTMISTDDEDVCARPRDLGVASDSPLVRRPFVVDAWVEPLLWSLGKVYCCHGPSERYEALVDDQEDWSKVAWTPDDGALILRVAADAAKALAMRESRPCAVQVALECVFGSRWDRGRERSGGGSDSIAATAGGGSKVVAAPAQEARGVQNATGDLRTAIVIGAWRRASSGGQLGDSVYVR